LIAEAADKVPVWCCIFNPHCSHIGSVGPRSGSVLLCDDVRRRLWSRTLLRGKLSAVKLVLSLCLHFLHP
jgi:hypothetical protein